ncbi:MAG TPA: fumarylacetoacetate hydrolase family protein [Acidimicrobiales bacterium]|nr:fumarylacetoacetate hydrolase family protein [Acidimicrobiales bacterium]
MRIARVGIGQSSWVARVEGDTVTPIVEAPEGLGRDALRDALAAGVDLAAAPAVADSTTLDAVRLQSPLTAPTKVLAIGLNYADHARESGLEPPKSPVTFVKTNNSIVGPGDGIRYSKEDSEQVDYEAELAVVIGRRARHVSEADALGYVFGYTNCNDVSARDAQFSDGQWIRGKSFDTFCPLGPWVVTADEIPDPQALRIACRVNGTTLQDSTTGEMIFGVAAIISYLSRFMTLEPGDVIATGTPFGVGFARTPPVFLLNGDVVEIDIEGIGVLTNPVVVE